ncbi:hypothetical protein TNCV_296551 [Trichonephila clavipes]|nr:hypothetical protein TNCV_296551 [Trichonephila clavipes]
MRDSSLKTTSFHSAPHILFSLHHWWWRRLWLLIKGRPNNGRLVERPLCCIRRRTGRGSYAVHDVPHHHTSWDRTMPLYSEGWFETFTTASPHTRTIVVTAQNEHGFNGENDLIPFCYSAILSIVTLLQMEAYGSVRKSNQEATAFSSTFLEIQEVIKGSRKPQYRQC